MDNLFKDKLSILANDDIMLEAIRRAFEERLEKDKPTVKDEDNQVIGEKYRAYDQCKTVVKEVLEDIRSYKEEKVDSDHYNKGK